jgi:hypothetical protein
MSNARIAKTAVWSIIGVVTFLALMFIFSTVHFPYRTHRQIVEMDVVILSKAMEEYKDHFGKYPSGDAVDIARQLTGENPDNFVFVYKNKFHFNASGAFIDPNGHPYTFRITSTSANVTDESK